MRTWKYQKISHKKEEVQNVNILKPR